MIFGEEIRPILPSVRSCPPCRCRSDEYKLGQASHRAMLEAPRSSSEHHRGPVEAQIQVFSQRRR
jgi:hypothetical protein